jgi:hypothetical protein
MVERGGRPRASSRPMTARISVPACRARNETHDVSALGASSRAYFSRLKGSTRTSAGRAASESGWDWGRRSWEPSSPTEPFVDPGHQSMAWGTLCMSRA